MLVLAVDRGAAGARALLPLVVAILIGAALLIPFRRLKGGEGGGSEKAIVGVTWFLAAVGLAIYLAT